MLPKHRFRPVEPLLLREVLGAIRLEPRRGDVGRPYYLAQTEIDCIALLATLQSPYISLPSRQGES